MISIVLVEDNKTVRDGLCVLLGGTDGLSCVTAYDSCEPMLDALARDVPDIVLMDIELPGMSGIEGTVEIKRRRPETEVVILTVHQDDYNIFKALCAGACGYLLKNTAPAELIAGIQDAHDGGSPMSSVIARRVVTLFQDKFQAPKEAKVHITEREQAVLTGLAEGQSYHAIADSLCVAPDTIRYHIRNIYGKLQVHSQSAAVARAIREELI